MTINVSFNGVTYPVPTTAETGWSSLTNYLTAIAAGAITKSDFKQNVREVSDVSVTVLSSDSIIVLTNASDDIELFLPVGPEGKILTIVDRGTASRSLSLTDVGVVQSYKSVLALLSNGATWSLLYRIDYFDINLPEAFSLVQRDETGLVVSENLASAVKMPAGTTAERPVTPQQSMLRFNTDTHKLEVYNGTVWADLDTTVASVTELKDLSDVDDDLAPTTGQLFKYDGAEWVSATPAIGDNSDVDTTGVADGQVLAYNAGEGKFKPSTISGSVTSVNSQTGIVVLDLDDIEDGATYVRATETQLTKLDGLIELTTKGDIPTHDGTDAVRLPVGTDGQVLTADSTAPNGIKWGAGGGGGASALNDLSDVTITTPATNDRLSYQGGTWINVPDSPAVTSLFTADGSIAQGDIVGISSADKVRAYVSGGSGSSVGTYGTGASATTGDNKEIDILQITETLFLVASSDPLNSYVLDLDLYEVTAGVVSLVVNKSITTQPTICPTLCYSHSDVDYWYIGLSYYETANCDTNLHLIRILKSDPTSISDGGVNTVSSIYSGGDAHNIGLASISVDSIIIAHENASRTPSITTLTPNWSTGGVTQISTDNSWDAYSINSLCRIGIYDYLVCMSSPTEGTIGTIVTVNPFNGFYTYKDATLFAGLGNRNIKCDLLSLALNGGKAIVVIHDITLSAMSDAIYALVVECDSAKNLNVISTEAILTGGSMAVTEVEVTTLSETNAVAFVADGATHNYAYPLTIGGGTLSVGLPATDADDDTGAAIGCKLTESTFIQYYNTTADQIVNVVNLVEGIDFRGQFVAASSADDGDPVLVTTIGENPYLSGLIVGARYYNDGDGGLTTTQGVDGSLVGTAKNSTTIIVGR